MIYRHLNIRLDLLVILKLILQLRLDLDQLAKFLLSLVNVLFLLEILRYQHRLLLEFQGVLFEDIIRLLLVLMLIQELILPLQLLLLLFLLQSKLQIDELRFDQVVYLEPLLHLLL